MPTLVAAYNESQMLFLGNWGPRWLIAFVLIGLVILALTWLDLREMRASHRRILLGLRAAAIALGILFAAEPALELRDVERIPNNIAVLFDDSASGQLPADAKRSRQGVLRQEAKSFDTSVAPDRHHFDFFRFADALHPSSKSALESLEASAPRTDILHALEQVQSRYARDKLGGIVLLSDGADNATLASRVAPDQELDENTRKLLERLGVPVHTVQIAEKDAIKDIAIREVHHDNFAFVRNAVKVDVDIEVHGYSKGTYPVRLRRDGEVLQTRDLTISKDTQTYTLSFEFVPEQIGKEIYSLDIPVDREDAVPQNNRAFFVLNVIRDKIRVLQVVGKPTWDVRFLRQLLKGDPNVELVSFFILRDYYNVNRAPENEMSLIPFPTHELFEEQLGSFDLIVLQDFGFEPYGVGQYLRNIHNYVKRGGGLLMLGGDGGFSTGGYAGTPIEAVLPVQLPRAQHTRSSTDLQEFHPQLTEAGARHPITRMEFDTRKNQELWEKLPKLHGTNIVREAKPGAVVLATHPRQRTDSGPMPVLAIQDQDKGRSMAFTVDSSWRWNYEWVLKGGSSRPYTSFWNSAIRWLIRDPALNLIQLDIGQSVVQAGETVDIEVRAFRADYSPAADAELTLTLQTKSLDDLIAGSNAEQEHDTITLTTDDQGLARWQVTADQEAAWRVEASMNIDENLDATADEIFLSTHQSNELRDVQPRDDLLKSIADASGGKFIRSGRSALAKLPFEAPRVNRVSKRKSVDVWSAPWILLLFVVLLAAEWHLRRRWGRL